jgi:hypothetical protein
VGRSISALLLASFISALQSLLDPTWSLETLWHFCRGNAGTAFFCGKMADAAIVHLGETHQLRAIPLANKCTTFEANIALLTQPYSVKAPVSLGTFRDFIADLRGTPTNITNDNFGELAQLYHEFGYGDLGQRLTAFCQAPNSTILPLQLLSAIGRISQLELQP